MMRGTADVSIGAGLTVCWRPLQARQWALEVRRAGPARSLIGYCETDASAFEWLTSPEATGAERDNFALAETMLRRAT